MIGNDIVDLALAQKESNWKRKGFLDKIFTQNEQVLILNSKNPQIMVWNLWSRKEAAYKIYNRETGIRGYFPLQLECIDLDSIEEFTFGKVVIKNQVYYTKTEIESEYIHTIAVAKKQYFSQIKTITCDTPIFKINGIPFMKQVKTNCCTPVSISNHGRFWSGIRI